MLQNSSYGAEYLGITKSKHGRREEVGMQVLLYMLRTDPDTKATFGFTEQQNVEGNLKKETGSMDRGTRSFFLCLIKLSGFWDPTWKRRSSFWKHQERIIRGTVWRWKKLCTILGDGIREVLAMILHDNLSPCNDAAWKRRWNYCRYTSYKIVFISSKFKSRLAVKSRAVNRGVAIESLHRHD